MDEGDDYVPQITQMDYSLMGDGGAGQGTTPTYYDPAMQIYGAAGVADSSSAAAVMASQHQQRYGVASTAAGLHHHQQHQQLMQSQQNAQQQRHYMAHQMAPPAQQQMYQMGMSHAANSAMEMISRMPGGGSAAGSSSALQSAQQATNAAAVQSSKSASKSKTPRKSKKALAAEAANAEAAAAAATASSSTNKPQNMVDPRGFPLSAQPQLPPGYQTPAGFNSAVYQQQQAYAMQQKYLYMQQQHQQQQTASQQQQQQHPSWMADPMMNPAAYGHNPHSSTAAAAQAQQPSAYPTGPPSAANFHGPAGYAASGNGMPMSNAGYYPGMKPPFADQQQHAAGVTGYCAYGGGNVPTSSAVQAQQHQLQGQQQQQQHGQPQPPVGRFPASSSYMSAPADSTTPCASSAAATSTMANAPPVPSGMHPYYAAQQQQQQQQHFPHMPYGAATAQQQAGGAKPPHLQAQQAHINSSTPTTLATQTPVTSTMMPQFSTLHQQQQQTSMQQQQQQSHGGKDGQPHGAQQTPWGAPTGMSGFNDQPSGYPPAGSSGQLPAAAHPVMMQFHQQLQQIHADQQRLHREIYDCDVQINFLQQQQPRTPELTQRIEQLKQQSNYERSQFAALQQKQAYIMSSMNALSEQQKQQAYMQASGGVPSKQMATSAVLHGGPVGLGAGMMPMMPSIGQLGQPAMGSSAVATQMDLKFASMTPTPSQPPPQPQPPARQPPSMLSSPALNSSQVSPTGFKKAMEFGVSSASSTIPPSSSFSVMQTSANQVQVNITPEPTGRTLISVYHQQYQMATPVQEQVGLSGTTPTAANEYSIPPEPVPPKRQSVVDGDISAVPTASFPSNNTIAALLPTAGEPTTNTGLSPPPTVPTNSWEQPPIRPDAAVSMTSAFNSAGHGLTVTTSISTPTTSCSSLTTRATTAKVAKERKEKESLKVEETLATSDLTDDIYAQAIASPRPAIPSSEPAEVVNDEDVAYAYYDPFNESSTSVNTAVVGTSAEMSDMIEIIPHEVTDEASATVVTPNDYTTVAKIDAKRPSQGRINNGETEPENDIGDTVETKPNGDLSTRKAHEDLVTALAEAEDLLTAENNNGGDEKHEVILFEQQEEATIEEAEDDPPLIEKQLQPLLDSSLLLARPSKRKGRKTKATELTEEGSLDDTDDYTETKPIKKKKKASSKDRPKEHKASASRKRRRQADGNLSSGEDDENDGDFIVRHKKKKISKAAIAKELNVAEENLDDFVEKRRSGRKKVNKNYGDREMDVDLDELVMEDLPSSSGHKAEHQSTSTAKSNAAAAAAAVSTVDDDALFSAPPEDCASGVEAPQEEWIVEKILGYRLAKRKVRKEFSDKKPAVREAPQPDDESVAATETADTVPSSSSKAGGTTNEMIQEPGFSESTVVDGVDELGIRSTEESDVTVDGERTESNKIELKSEAVDENENEMEPSSSQIAEERGQEAIEMDENKEKRENESTTKSANKSGKEKEANNKDDDGEEVEEEAEQYYVKYKNRSYIHCEWKFADELETMDKRAAGKITRYKMKCSDVVNGEEYFNEDYVIVDRVLDDVYDEEDEEYYAYVKWRSLPYGECSWESIKNVPQSKIDAARNRNFVVDTFKLKEMSRPSPKEWKKISSDRVFKDGNTLREYQVEGVNWLLFCYFNRQNCILADEMGLGKTVQTITFLQGVYDLGIHGPFLIVVPLSTLHNWEREFETWTNMNAVVYHGSAAGRQIIQDYELYYAKSAVRGESKKKPVIKFDALITTFEMVVSDCEVLRRINYRVCVIDEAHRLKNRNCKLLTGGLGAFKMEHRVLLTGTPLQNNIQELYSLLNFLEPERFSSSESFLEQFGQFGQCQTEEQVQKLQEILKPMMLRRLKEDVEKTLQPKEETIIEIQLSNIQKKYYRAILERNFTHLIKGGSMPSLMNTMMELRKCCNHPFLINGAEEQIMSEVRAANPDCESEEQLQAIGLTQASGKLVLIDKLLPKLRQDGHKVLIFSQMVRMLDLIEEFLIHKSYPFERIDGNVRGDLRQAAIDRFSRQDTERFVFLLCTRAGGLGINLTAADTVIIFDSDWNPQNDLQAQARCHRIGQTKMVKVYRLITSNTYEREMFDKASLKLGLDKAVLQSMAPRDSGQQLTRKEVEDLLRKGAYGAVMEEDNEGSKFSEEDIDTILQRRTQTIRLEPGIRGSTFAKASFTSSDNREDIDINDPNFWSKWAKKVNIDVDAVLTAKKTPNDENLILLEPRSRRKRFEENYNKASESADESAAVSADDDSEGMNGNASTSRNGDGNDGNVSSPSKKVGIGTWKKRRRATTGLAHEDGDEDYVGGIGISASGYRPNELAFNKSEFFKVEKLLGAWGWGRWTFVKQKTEIALSENDMEHISRTLLLYCVREFRGDEKIRDFVWRLITPRGGLVCKSGEKSDFSGGIYHEGWAALPEYNPPSFAVDHSFQRHVHRHANKLLARIHHLQFLQTRVIGEQGADLAEDCIGHADVQLQMPNAGDPPMPNWDVQCDKSFLLGVYKHGMENYESMRQDPKLCFIEKGIAEMPTILELNTRFKRLISMLQRQIEAAAAAAENAKSPKMTRWPRNEEVDYMNVLRTYGVKDDSSTANVINWTRFRELSTCLQNKTDAEMLEQLYCVLAMCTRQQGGELSPVDQKRADCVETITGQQAEKLMNRIHLMRKIHAIITTNVHNVRASLKLCSTSAMPKDWAEAHDEALLIVVDKNGLDGILPRLANNPAFQKISGIEERMMLRRIVEICTTLETGKWNGIASIDLIEDDEPNSSGSIGRYARQKTNDSSRASSGSPGPIRGRGASRRPPTAASGSARSAQRTGDASAKSGKSGNASGTANITSVTSLDLAELEKEKMKSLMQQHQSLLEKAGQTNANYMMSLLGLSGLTSTAAPSSSKSTATTSAASSSAMQVQAALLAMTSAFGVSDAATASALASMLTGIPMSSLLDGTTAASSSVATTSSNKVSSSNDNDALNLSKRKTGNVSANLNLGTASSSSASVSKSGKTSILNSTNTRTNTTTSAGSSKTTTEAKTTSTTVPTASTSATNQATGIDKFSNLGIAELLAYSNFPPDSVIPVIHVDIKVAPAADKMPKLKNLNEWLAAHPQYTIDLAKLMQTPFTPSVTAAGNRSRTKENTAVSTSESTATCAAGGSITTGGSARNTASKLLNNTSAAGGSSRGQLPVNPAARATPSATPMSSAAAAPQPSSSSKNSAGVSASAIAKMASDMSSFAGLKNLLQIGVFKKSTGVSLSQDKWPMLTELAKWLDKNPDCNVHSSYADIAKAILSKGYHNRLGGDFAGTPSMSTSSTNSAAVLNSATTTQSLSSVFPSTSSSSSTAALTQLLSAAANPMAFSSASVSQISPSTSSLISGSVTGGNITSTSATTSSASSLQNIEALQMQLLLQQLMTPSMMTNYNPYSLLGGTGSTSAASTSNGTVNANSLNNLTANLNAGALLRNSAPSTSKANNNNNSNEALMAALLGLGGPAAEQMTASLLNQALTGITPTSHISTATNLSGTGGSKTSNSTSATAQSLASLTNRVQPVNSMSNSAASSLMAEAALAAEILTNPTLMTSMLNPLGPISSNYSVNNNQSNKASASSSTAFTSNSLTNPSLSAASSMAGLDAATMATLAATFGGLDAATLAALAGVVSLPTTAPTASTSRKATTSAASTSAEPLISVTSTSRTTNPNRAGLLNAVVEKLAKSNTPAAANSTSSEVNDAPKDVKELADEDEEAKS